MALSDSVGQPGLGSAALAEHRFHRMGEFRERCGGFLLLQTCSNRTCAAPNVAWLSHYGDVTWS